MLRQGCFDIIIGFYRVEPNLFFGRNHVFAVREQYATVQKNKPAVGLEMLKSTPAPLLGILFFDPMCTPPNCSKTTIFRLADYVNTTKIVFFDPMCATPKLQENESFSLDRLRKHNTELVLVV